MMAQQELAAIGMLLAADLIIRILIPGKKNQGKTSH